jgi:dCTP deaminase
MRNEGRLLTVFLNDAEIKQLVAERPDFISDFVPQKVAAGQLPTYGLEPHGYTFRLHPTIIWFRPKRGLLGGLTDATSRDAQIIELGENETFLLPPFHCLLVSSLETFSLPPDIVGLLFGKTTYTKRGLFYNMTVVDAGFSGRLAFCVVNLNPERDIEIFPYGGIAQIMFVRCAPAEVPYIPREALLAKAKGGSRYEAMAQNLVSRQEGSPVD